MKKMNYAFCASLLCGAFITVVQAQETKPAPPLSTGPRPMYMTNYGTNMPQGMARPMMRDRTEMLARMLNLTEEQKAKVKPIVDEETKQLEEIRAKTQEKLKPILTEEQFTRLSRMSGGMGGPSMGMPPRTVPSPPRNVQPVPGLP